MGHNYDITPEELARLIAFLEEGRDSELLRSDIPQRFNNLYMRFQARMLACLKGSENKNFTLERSLDRFRQKEKEKIEAGLFEESTRDSAEIADALLFCLQKKEYSRRTGVSMTKSKFLHILFLAYASWLTNKKERLFAEHPVATEYGPQFWRVYKRLNVVEKIPYTAFEKIAAQNAGVARFLENVANKYWDYTEKTLSDFIMMGDPYKNALPRNNNGKWNKEITDSDIYAWKSSGK